MIQSVLHLRDERQMRSVLGTSLVAFNILLEAFDIILKEYYHEKYIQQVANGTRKRKPGGGRISPLKTPADKLVFGLFYLKTYPTIDVLAEKFNLSRSTSSDNVHKIIPLIKKALNQLEVLPKREFESAKEFQDFLKKHEIETLLMDATEREHFRYKEKIKRDAMFSGKKKVNHEEYHSL